MNPSTCERDPVLGYQRAEFIDIGLTSENAATREADPACPVGMGRLVLASGGVSPLDSHRVKEAWLVASGEAELVFQGRLRRRLVPGNIVMFDSYESHVLTNTGAVDFVCFSVWWD